MSDATGIMDRLKVGTAELHKQAESRPLQRQLGAGTLPRAAFAAYQVQLLLVHDQLERCLDEQVARASHPAFAVAWQGLARHSENLRRDLIAHGVDATGVAPLSATADLLGDLDAWSAQDDLSLIGALYVLEGSMNGNRFISKALQRAWGIDAEAGLSYLDPYGDDQRAMWMDFRNRVNEFQFTEAESLCILAGADRMFKAIGEISDEASDALLIGG